MTGGPANGGDRRRPLHHHWPLWAFVLLLVAVVLLARSAGGGEQGARGKVLAAGGEDYAEHCVSCHGATGAGDGPLAAKLVKPPKPLTGIAEDNGGTFPFWRIFDIIAGEAAVPDHDTHQMPEFYQSLRRDDFQPGYLPAHLRVLALTHYVESLQK